MATIVLGAVGRAFGGPIGGLLGSVAGGFVDRALFSPGGVRDIGRIDNPVVQSAAYGEAIPVIVGRMRAAGNLIWSSGIAEQVARGGGGKGGAAANQYSYSASFAVGLAARRIAGVGRIWADGRLVRDAEGTFLLPMVMRLHPGDEDQPVDPLIAAAEGGETPAYRGLAYAVFEDLALGEFGNRIPNLTFEIIADEREGTLDLGGVAQALVQGVDGDGGRLAFAVEGVFSPVSGFFFGRPGSLSEALAPLVEMVDAAVVASGDGLVLRDIGDGAALPVIDIAGGSEQARADSLARTRDRQSYGGDSGPDVFQIGFYDVGRDYQSGLQRVRRGSGSRLGQGVLPAAMSPDAAKTLAARTLSRRQASRLKRTISLPWRELGLAPGMLVRLGGAVDVWRVRELRFEQFVMGLSLERVAAGAGVALRGDGGRVPDPGDGAAGPTQLQLMELPGLGAGTPTVPVLQVAAAGASAAWRRAGFEISRDGGASYAGGGLVSVPTAMGVASSVLAAGATAVWDVHNSVEVELLGVHMWLEGKSDVAVLQGANLALLGDELIQFGRAEATGPGRFRLSRLLRGRRGTEAAVAGHGTGERFVLLDSPAPVGLELGLEMLGQTVLARPTGAFDVGAGAEALVVRGTALLPLAPAHLRMARVGDDVVARWVRRSRGGFAWLDFVDAPLAEAVEAYRVRISLDGVVVREREVVAPGVRYAAADRVADGDGAVVGVEISQLSAAVGPGRPAVASLPIS
ncbi:GTA baseplate fiber-binding domain-containing protein [Polymorphobacter sp.]|uniref:GTA baseplate fiber-binding domain-containing protein n=1 Tax=Polymorphobacter sp. TaxID=1909290 RepID=UPI003F71F1D4